jgi:hypothetical protein
MTTLCYGQQLLSISIAVSGRTKIVECGSRHLLLNIPNVHSTSRLALDCRQLKIVCSLLKFFDGYGRIKGSFNPNSSSPTKTNGKDSSMVRDTDCPKASQVFAREIFLQNSNF